MAQQQTPDNSEIPDTLSALAQVVHDNRETMTAFNQAMHERGELSLRIARRTTQIIRVGVLGMLVINAVLFFLVYTLSTRIGNMTDSVVTLSGRLNNIDSNFSSMTQSVQQMAESVNTMNTNMAGMREDMTSLPAMASSVNELNTHILGINGYMGGMYNTMYKLQQDTGQINYQLGIMNSQVGAMVKDVDTMSGPMKMMPFN